MRIIILVNDDVKKLHHKVQEGLNLESDPETLEADADSGLVACVFCAI